MCLPVQEEEENNIDHSVVFVFLELEFSPIIVYFIFINVVAIKDIMVSSFCLQAHSC